MLLISTVAIATPAISVSSLMHWLLLVLWPLLPVLHKIAELFELVPEWHAFLRLLGIKLDE